ncbi:MAG TPA: ECF transporter S component [Candidatus Atribacteria bacterium]|nr:ECF transporter S component [Candidatus Atribacteria bacterium]
MLSKGFIFEFNGRNLAKIGVLSALAFLLMLISFPIPLFPMFLEIDISDLPALLGAFALGPLAGVIIELMKNVLNIALEGTKTGFVGELSNFIVGSAFVMPASIVYMRSKNKQNALYGMIVGIMSMTIIACFSNYYLIVPLYSKANKLIVDMKSYILFAVIPFNILKSSLVSLITLLIYKKLSPILHM